MIVLQKNIDKTEQYDHPPQAALSFTAILKNNEILLLLKIAEVIGPLQLLHSAKTCKSFFFLMPMFTVIPTKSTAKEQYF